MTIIWMEHPQHGRYPCTSADVDLFRKAGWKETPPKQKKPAFDPDAVVVASTEEPAEAEEEKPKLKAGRKPKTADDE